MKQGLLLAAGVVCGCCAYAQNSTVDNYTNSTNKFVEIGTAADGISNPQDLDFAPGRKEIWVLNKETYGGSTVIFFNPGEEDQFSQFRKDSHNEHFMARAVAISFGDNQYFGTAQEVLNTAGPGSTFMGPALWNSDTTVYARMHQNNWEPGKLLGSHIDMLHQSPYGMGIAHDHDNVYWYFDGHNGNICRYDFAEPHGVGEDDHSDGRILRYTDVPVTRTPDVPSHLALDKQNKWLYVVETSNGRVFRMKTDDGTIGGTLPMPGSGAEPLAEYKEVTGATKQVMVTGLTEPSGVDYRNDRLFVSDNANGNIYIYNTTTVPATLVGTIITGSPGVKGIRVTWDNKIWYVNSNTNKLMMIENSNVTSVDEMVSKNIQFSVFPNPAHGSLNIQLDELNGEKTQVRIFDMTGKQVYEATATTQLTTINTSGWATGAYNVIITQGSVSAASKVMVQ